MVFLSYQHPDCELAGDWDRERVDLSYVCQAEKKEQATEKTEHALQASVWAAFVWLLAQMSVTQIKTSSCLPNSSNWTLDGHQDLVGVVNWKLHLATLEIDC